MLDLVLCSIESATFFVFKFYFPKLFCFTLLLSELFIYKHISPFPTICPMLDLVLCSIESATFFVFKFHFPKLLCFKLLLSELLFFLFLVDLLCHWFQFSSELSLILCMFAIFSGKFLHSIRHGTTYIYHCSFCS